MQIAGITIATADALELIAILCASGRVTTADTLATAWGDGREIVGLTVNERDQIFCALDDPPDGLCELRTVLLQQWKWRRHVGL